MKNEEKQKVSKLETQFRRAKNAGVPILTVETVDQPNTIAQLLTIANGESTVILWDVVRGVVGLNSNGEKLVAKICGRDDPALTAGNPTEMLTKILNVPERTYVLMSNAHRFISDPTVSQGLANLREKYKSQNSMIVLLCPSIVLPSELKQDVMIIDDPLPSLDQVTNVIKSVCEDNEAMIPSDIEKIADTLIGLSPFSAEQTLATCMFKNEKNVIDIDRESLWERKRKAIEQTPGLSIWRGGEKFEDIGGCENIKSFLTDVFKGKEMPRSVVFMDEIEKALAGAGGDTSGVSQDQLGVILSYMQDKEVDGLIFIGPPGAAKSAIAKAAGNEANIPTVSLDLGAMKNALVGKSGEQTRAALNVVEAISQGRTLFIATCNSIGVLPPELRRRFTMGTFFFDLPTMKERSGIWGIYEKKYKVSGKRPMDHGWTGAEIKQCCKLAWKLEISLEMAATYIVPVAVSAKDQIDTLRSQASGKFIGAAKPGLYSKSELETPSAPTIAGTRKIDLKDRNVN